MKKQTPAPMKKPSPIKKMAAASAMANAKKAGSEGAQEYMSGLPKNKKK
jgi:hypothetical protein